MGDYIVDDEFDDSYDGLIRLGAILGDVRGRGTPEEVINALPTATYKEWSTEPNCEIRCPICLDDVSFCLFVLCIILLMTTDSMQKKIQLDDYRSVNTGSIAIAST